MTSEELVGELAGASSRHGGTSRRRARAREVSCRLERGFAMWTIGIAASSGLPRRRWRGLLCICGLLPVALGACSSSSSGAGAGCDADGTWDVSFQWSGRTPGQLVLVVSNGKVQQLTGPGVGAATGTLSTSGDDLTWKLSDGSTWTGLADATCDDIAMGSMTSSSGNNGTFVAQKQTTSGGGGCTTALPSGSYSRSCSGCVMQGTVLSCASCGDGRGGEPSAQIDTCSCSTATSTQNISNQNGVLTCGSSTSTRSGGCTSDSQCSSHCSNDCYQCNSGSCLCGSEDSYGVCTF